MSLTLLKRAIFNHFSFRNSERYRQIPRSPTSPDLERASSSSSGSYDSQDEQHELYHEKDGTTSQSAFSSPSSHSTSLQIDPRIVSSATIGLSDGLTVPFALTAGLSALGDVKVVIYGGLAELCAGAISMGLGGYLGAVSEIDAQTALSAQIHELILRTPAKAHALLQETLLPLRLPPVLHNTLTAHLTDSTRAGTLHHLLMALHHHTEPEPPPSPSSNSPSSSKRTQYRYAYLSAFTISLGYFLGGFVPLLPYIFLSGNINFAFGTSVAVTACCLLAFGYVKVWVVGETSRRKCLAGALQMLVLGGLAGVAAVGCVRLFGGVG